MLILERREGSAIYIGDDVKVTILGFSMHGKVRVAVEAPRDVPVWRSELVPAGVKPSEMVTQRPAS